MHPLFSSNRSFLAVLFFWLVISVFVAMLLVLIVQEVEVTNLYAQSFTLVVPWYLLFLFVCFSNFYICQLLPLNSSSVLVIIAVQWMATASSVGLWLLVGYLWSGEMVHFGFSDGRKLFLHTFNANWLLGAILYLIWILVHYVYFSAVSKERENSQVLQQKLLINDIEFKSVKAALHPHFMYNSLNMLANLSLVAPEKIHTICVQMADFLRYSVNYSKKERVTITDEINHIKNYLAIEQERFAEHLTVKFSVDKQVNERPVMPLLLFPLVENSIKHGIDSSTDPGFINIDIHTKDQRLIIHIENSFDKTGKRAASTGLGLVMLHKRLKAYYGSDATLRSDASDTCFKVQIDLPFSPAEPFTTSQLVTN